MAKRRRRSQVVKAAPTPANMAPAATFTAQQVQALLSMNQSFTGQVSQPLPRLDPMVPFGPGVPIQTGPIDPLRDDSQRPEPRIYEYPVSINLPGMTDRLVPWKVLRDAAEIPVVRDCIRIRKNEVTTLEWDIVVTKRALQQYRKNDPDTSSVEVKRKLREKLDPEVGRLVEFWQKPDFQQGESFVDWCTKLLEEHLTLDALAIYPFKDRAGERFGLRILDGSTIKPLLDHLGGRPMPPNPAYQQQLWGFPRGEFVADVDTDGEVLNGYSSDRLIYKRREVRTITPYGFSAVEQALQDVDLYLRRLEWDKAQYTDGVQPAGWILNDGHETWTPQQLLEYNRAFNDMYSGQTLQRMRYHLLPPGMRPQETADIPEKFKPDYHLHLVKLVAMHFDVTLSELGFTESKGLGSAGYHEGQENVQQRKATNPTLKWLQTVLTEISHTHLGMPPELEFRFLGLDAEEEAAADEVIENQLKSGRITWNESREEMGRAPFDFPEADMPVVQTTRGLIFVENASQLVEPGEEVTPVQSPPLKAPPEGDDADPYEEEQQPGEQDNPAPVVQVREEEQDAKEQAKNPPAKEDGGDAAKSELAAYRKWARNGHTTSKRPFTFEHCTEVDVTKTGDVSIRDIRAGRVRFKAGDAGPKAHGRHWPAWEKDQQVAAHWAGELRAALSGAPTRALAERWLAVRKAVDPQEQDRRRDAEQWLLLIGFTLAPLILKTLLGLYVDGYLIGDKAAQALLSDAEHVDWGTWEPGDTAASRLLIAADGMEPGLQQLLGDADRIAAGINGTRLKDLGKVLGRAVDEQPTVDELDAELQAVLDDEATADLVALTETSRAVNDAALKRYDTARLDGVTAVAWETADSACARCVENAEAGPIPMGQAFPSGSYSPPDHPHCRCALVPVRDR